MGYKIIGKAYSTPKREFTESYRKWELDLLNIYKIRTVNFWDYGFDKIEETFAKDKNLSPFELLRLTVRIKKFEFAGNTIEDKRASASFHLWLLADKLREKNQISPADGIKLKGIFYPFQEVNKMIEEEMPTLESCTKFKE